jgi:gliding motility-associated-like protein
MTDYCSGALRNNWGSMTGGKPVFILFALLFFNIAVTFGQVPNINYVTPQTYTVNVPIPSLLPTNTGGAVPATIYGQVTTFAGSTTSGSTNGQGTGASFYAPAGVATDADGNIYVADEGGNLIRKITPGGLVSTVAGTGVPGSNNGAAGGATFNGPTGVVVDNAGDIFVADYNNNLIRKITGGVVSTVTGIDDDTGVAAIFDRPQGLTIDATGNLFVAEYGTRLIREITPGGAVSTIASDGDPIFYPTGVTVDAAGNVYFADQIGNTIRKINPAGVVSIFAGTPGVAGSADGANATFNYPTGVTIDKLGNLYVADQDNNAIRKITPAGVVSTIAGGGTQGNNDGIGQAAKFFSPTGVATDNAGNLFVADLSNNEIREITLTGYAIDKPLPPGLTFDGTTGKISGTPTAASPAANYTVTAYNASGSNSTVVNITVVDAVLPPIIFNPIPPKTICDVDFDPGATINSAATSGISYTSSNQTVATIVANQIHITGVGSSVITATDGTTTAMQTLTVTGSVTPIVTISPPTISACPGVPITFTATAINAGSNPAYQWQINGQNQAGANSPQFTSSTLVNGDKITCVITTNIPCAVANLSIAEVDFTGITPSQTTVTITTSANEPVCTGTKITFTANANTTDNDPGYQWMVNGNNQGNNSNTFTSNSLNDGDVVTCLLSSAGSCIINPTATSNPITVSISSASGCLIVINNAFTPNNDGINDTWDMPFLDGYPGCTVAVYNRYGALVYNSINYPKSWDGTYKGSALPVGTYYYIIDLKNGKRPFSGPLTILR